MKKRHVVPALAVIAAAAVAVPALAEPEPVTPRIAKVSARAMAKSHTALRVSRAAKRQARGASGTALAAAETAASARGQALAAADVAGTAHAEANRAETQAATTEAQLAATRIVSATEPGLVATSAAIGEYEDLGGPSLQVTVPASGLIEVWAQVEIKDEEGGAVALYEDGQKVPGISQPEFCGDDSALIDMQGGGGTGEFQTFSTPPVLNFLLGCVGAAAPGPVLLSRPPGVHTYELRYSECSCGGEAEFRNRVLRIAPRP